MQNPSKIVSDIGTEFSDCVSGGYGCDRRFEQAIEKAFEAGRVFERQHVNAELKALVEGAKQPTCACVCRECAEGDHCGEGVQIGLGDCFFPLKDRG